MLTITAPGTGSTSINWSSFRTWRPHLILKNHSEGSTIDVLARIWNQLWFRACLIVNVLSNYLFRSLILSGDWKLGIEPKRFRYRLQYCKSKFHFFMWIAEPYISAIRSSTWSYTIKKPRFSYECAENGFTSSQQQSFRYARIFLYIYFILNVKRAGKV